ncbi:hypothetical protein [Phascolarctobacterium succinatutens]|uniref:hypothetical protein n=1 Tax=Phascolarctobacterium succinatutens TaxID=626940 RepID=UPI003AF0E259
MFTVQNNNIALIRGDSGAFGISITDTNGNPVELTDGDVLTFTLRRTPRSPTIVLQKIIAGGELDIKPADTEGLTFGAYVYDIELKRADGYVDTVIPPHEFLLMEEVTY